MCLHHLDLRFEDLGIAIVGKIFISYRRADDPAAAWRVRDRLATDFGDANVFFDVHNLRPGQLFDQELAKALAECDVLIAILGPRWVELLNARATSARTTASHFFGKCFSWERRKPPAMTSERDYVREEIAQALKRKIVVIPVRVGCDGQLPQLPHSDALPEDIRSFVSYQSHDVVHERFQLGMEVLAKAITEFLGLAHEEEPEKEEETERPVPVSNLLQHIETCDDPGCVATLKLREKGARGLQLGKGRHCELAVLAAAGDVGMLDEKLVKARRKYAEHLGVNLIGPIANSDWANHAWWAAQGNIRGLPNAKNPIPLGTARVSWTPSPNGRAKDHYRLFWP
jgi:hypothetical protein